MSSNMSYRRNIVPNHGHGAGSLMSQGASGEPLFLASPAVQLSTTDLTNVKSNFISKPTATILDNQVMLFDGTTGRATKGGEAIVVLSSDFTVDFTTFGNVTGLAFPVVAGGVYDFEFGLIWLPDNGTYGVGFALTSPGHTIGNWWMFRHGSTGTTSAAGTLYNMAYWAGNESDNALYDPSGRDSAGNITYLKGMIIPTSSGNIQLIASAENASYPVDMLAGSFVKYRRIL